MEIAMNTWVTNNENAAMLLKAADRAYERAIQKSDALPLAQKVIAISAARQIREVAYKMAASA